jgi:prepilin-type N-terminal cleavage/methylation domain-containing protein
LKIMILESHNNKKGFTLVEALLVAAIFSIIAVGIAATLFSGIRLWGWFNSIDSEYADTIFAFERISQELRQSLNNSDIGFQGSASEFFFPVLDGGSVTKVIYLFDANEKMLLRKSISLQDVILGKDDYNERNILFLDEFYLDYLAPDIEKNSYAWKDTWEKKEGVFPAVRIKAKLKDEEITKRIFIPIAKR